MRIILCPLLPLWSVTAPFSNSTRGTGEKKTNAHVHLQNPSKKHPPTSFFSFLFSPPTCFFIAFPGASQQVGFKNTKKSMSKCFEKMRKNPFRFFLGEREPLNGLILIEATYRNGIHGGH
jgi:hypothetical protein